MSLIEGRKNNQIILRMLKSFHLDILKRNFIDIFILYKRIYGNKYVKDCFKHVNFPLKIQGFIRVFKAFAENERLRRRSGAFPTNTR